MKLHPRTDNEYAWIEFDAEDDAEIERIAKRLADAQTVEMRTLNEQALAQPPEAWYPTTAAEMRAQAAPAEGVVYVLISHSDSCVIVQGVYSSLDAAQRSGEEDAEQSLTWHQYNTGEASHIIPPFNHWTSNTVDCGGAPLGYTIDKCSVDGWNQEQPRGWEARGGDAAP